MNLVADKACFNTELKLACKIIAIFFFVVILISCIFTPHFFGNSHTLIGFVITIVANVCLYFGAHKDNQYLVLVWLIQAVLILIGWPIAVLGVIFNFGGYRQTAYFDNVFLIIIEYIINLIIFLLLARIVYSFWHQLRNSQSKPQHTVVV